MSDLPEKPKTVEVRRVTAHQSLPKDYFLVDLPPVNGITKPKALDLGGGFVAHFDVPPGWEKNRDPVDRRFKECHWEHDCNVEVQISDLGIPIAAADTSHMKKLFGRINLTLDSADIAFLQQALNYGSRNPIIVQAAQVHDLNGERVVDFVGRYNYPNTANSSVRCCLLDVDGTSRFVAPVTFSAPPAVFNKFLPQADQIFKSMVFLTEHRPFRNR
jgi:hypothetical protein